MERLRLAALVASLLCACAHGRVPADAGADRTAQSGVKVKFQAPAGLPEGTTVSWDFGDGTPVATSKTIEHAFPRAGAFTVAQTIKDKDGEQRTATAKVTVLRRSVPMAIPADARAALVAERPWARVALQREVATRLGLRDFYEQIASSIGRSVGFDVSSSEQAAQHGLDPDEGLAIFTVREDPEALIVAVGISDEAKAEESLRRLLERDGSAESPSLKPFQLAEGKLPSGARAVTGTRNSGAETVAYTFKHGYLYLRTPAATDPIVALRGVDALPPDQGLESDATYQATVKRVGGGDFVFYSAPPPPQAPDAKAQAEPAGPLARTMGQLGASAFAVNVKSEALDVKLFAQLRNLSGEKLVQAFTPAAPPPDLAAALPEGAVAWFKLSGSPPALWHELRRAAGERDAELQERLHAMTGVEVEKEWLPGFTGNAGIAFYLDAGALLEAVLGEQVAGFDRSTLLMALEIAEGKAELVKSALDRAMSNLGASHLSAAKVELSGTPVWRAGEGAMMAAQKGNVLLLSIGGPHEEVVRSSAPLALALKGEGRTLGQGLKKAGVQGLQAPSDQLAYVDIRAVMRLLQDAAQQQGGAIGLGAALMADKIQGLQDAILWARPSADGVDGTISLRFGHPTRSGTPHQGQ